MGQTDSFVAGFDEGCLEISFRAFCGFCGCWFCVIVVIDELFVESCFDIAY